MALADHGKPPLVGRAAELAALGEFVRTVRRGGRLAVVEGEAGIGKTRLVEAALDLAREAGAAIVSAKAEELDAHRPYGAIADCVGGRRLDEHLGAFRVAETVLELLDGMCARGPVLMAIEDLHWADPGTLAVLARVAAGIERLPAALVVSARPQPRRPELERLLGVLKAGGARSVLVGPLDERSSAGLLEALLGAPPGGRLVRQARRAAGNPLFLSELVGALVADGAIVQRDDGADLATDEPGPSLPLTILHRLSFLPLDVVDLLGLASVLGASFAGVDLALLAGRPVSELVPALQSAQRAGVLEERGDRLAFRHELIRDALYEDMAVTVRRGLHAQLARALADAGMPAERVAEHLVRGAEPGDQRAVSSLVDAARALVERAPAAAVDLYHQAIGLSADPRARRAELLPELAAALVAAGILGEGEAECREALAGDPDAEWAGRLRLLLMFLLMRRGRTAEAVREGEAGLAGPELPEHDRVQLQALVAMSRVFQGEIEPAERASRAILERSGDELARALATNTLAMAADGRGAFSEAADLIAPNVRWADESGSRFAHDTRPHMILVLMLWRLDRLDEALATIQRARRAAESLGLGDAVPVYHYQLAVVHFLRGRLDDALAELATHAQLAGQTDIGWRLAAESLYALIAIHRDDLLAAGRHVDAAEREAAAGAPPFGTDLMVLARTRVLEATGNTSAALETIAGTFDAMAAAGAATFLPVLGLDLARLAARAGRPARAARVVEELQRIAELNAGAGSLEAGALGARGLLESDADALLAAVELLRGTGRVLEAARAAEDAATTGDGARELLEEARATYESCGATHDLARVDAALRKLGARRGVTGPRRRAATGWDALTDTELKVVRLVAERLTNPEIGERMFISRRTVQTHVSSALAKVGVANRRELAAEAARLGGWRLRVEGVGEKPEQPEPAGELTRRPVVDEDDA